MKKLVRCKTCGFIMEEGKLKDKCPACGVAAKLFEPYTPNISEKRARLLDFHIHPIIVHAPQAFSIFVLLFAILYFLFGGLFRNELLGSILVLTACLPFVAVAAIASGILDGKTRFRRLKTPILRQKIVFGVLFFIFSLFMIVLLLVGNIDMPLVYAGFLVCNAAAIVCSVVLARLGTSILNARMPG
jgi:uncharacterized membrane protein/rubredoxin